MLFGLRCYIAPLTREVFELSLCFKIAGGIGLPLASLSLGSVLVGLGQLRLP